jgi:hypothetical protein
MTPKDTNDLRQLLTLFSAELHQNSRAKGFWEDRDKILGTPQGAALVEIASLGLATMEIGEAMAGARKPQQDSHLPHYMSLEVEIADAIIYLLDLAAARNLRVVDAMLAKADYNRNRSRMHGGKLA